MPSEIFTTGFYNLNSPRLILRTLLSTIKSYYIKVIFSKIYIFLFSDGVKYDFKQCLIEPEVAEFIAATRAHGQH